VGPGLKAIDINEFSRHGYCGSAKAGRSQFQQGERASNPMAIGHEILTVKEVSEPLKVHHSTVYKMIREGRIPAFKIGSDWRFQKDQVVHWIAVQTIGAAQ
jgi:excisionase family DNA binding protein